MSEKRPVGRPRKERETELEEMTEAAVPELSTVALGIYQDQTDKQWYVATLKFDPVTGQAAVVDRTLAGEDKYFANEAFKIKTVELEIL